jgi:hypothetical protein
MRNATMLPTWKKQGTTEFGEGLPGIGQRASRTPFGRKVVADEYVKRQFPGICWTHVYTDGSFESATESGGGGIFVNLKSGEQRKLSMATSIYSNNYRAVAVEVATENLMAEKAIYRQVVILTDALSHNCSKKQ